MGAALRLWDFRSEADYLAAERAGITKHEYYQGEVTAMAGARLVHNDVQSAINAALRTRLRGRGCKTLGSDMRVHIPVHAFYTYPDVVVYCGKAELLPQEFDTLLNPTLLVEVLSPSTRGYDLGEKWLRYRAIASLEHYLVVDTEKPFVLLYSRSERPSEWLLTELSDLTDVLLLPALGVELPLQEIYEDVEFSAPGLRLS